MTTDVNTVTITDVQTVTAVVTNTNFETTSIQTTEIATISTTVTNTNEVPTTVSTTIIQSTSSTNIITEFVTSTSTQVAFTTETSTDYVSITLTDYLTTTAVYTVSSTTTNIITEQSTTTLHQTITDLVTETNTVTISSTFTDWFTSTETETSTETDYTTIIEPTTPGEKMWDQMPATPTAKSMECGSGGLVVLPEAKAFQSAADLCEFHGLRVARFDDLLKGEDMTSVKECMSKASNNLVWFDSQISVGQKDGTCIAFEFNQHSESFGHLSEASCRSNLQVLCAKI